MLRLSLFAISLVWASATALVDFVVVRTVFQEVGDFFTAGRTGLALFTKFNSLEFVLASVLFALSVLLARREPGARGYVLVSVLCLAIAGLYLFSLTPKLAQLTATWEYAEQVGTVQIAGEDIQALHQTYHRLYIGLDSLKLALLSLQTTLLGISLSRAKR